MAITEIDVAGYRSLRAVKLKLGRLNVVTGPNGAGKSNVYRAVQLIAEAMEGRLAESLLREGGMPSALWAGPRSKGPVRMSLRVRLDAVDYELICGITSEYASKTMFKLDPEVKKEWVRVPGARGAWPAMMPANSPMVPCGISICWRPFSAPGRRA